jgi:hypothetical protein
MNFARMFHLFDLVNQLEAFDKAVPEESYYEAVVISARTRKPRDKTKVQAGVQVRDPNCGTGPSSGWAG